VVLGELTGEMINNYLEHHIEPKGISLHTFFKRLKINGLQ